MYYTLQLLTALLTNSSQRLQEAILNIPRGITQANGYAHGSRGCLLILILKESLKYNNQSLPPAPGNKERSLIASYSLDDIQNIVIFEGAFEKILSIIRGEGNSDGGVVVQVC
ncbi:hypothetical protein AHAS_Ahas05G0050900 [Arachis hypogaea]